MPITKRVAHYGSPQQLLDYIEAHSKNVKGSIIL